MSKNLKHIKENTEYIEAEQVRKITLNKNGSITVKYADECKRYSVQWTGALQGVKLDQDGETAGYYVYIY